MGCIRCWHLQLKRIMVIQDGAYKLTLQSLSHILGLRDQPTEIKILALQYQSLPNSALHPIGSDTSENTKKV